MVIVMLIASAFVTKGQVLFRSFEKARLDICSPFGNENGGLDPLNAALL